MELETSFKLINGDGFIYYARHPLKGVSVFAAKDIPINTTIIENITTPISFEDVRDNSVLDNYPMAWTDELNVISWGAINLINHSDDPNLTLVRDIPNSIIRAVSCRDILKNTELTYKYNCTPWFVTL